MKYVPKTALSIKLPQGQVKTLFVRDTITPTDILRALDLPDEYWLEHNGKRLDNGISIKDQGIGHDSGIEIKSERRPWYERISPN